MNPKNLMVRCLTLRDGDVWVSHCLDYDLAAQGDTQQEAEKKLVHQIAHYLFDVLDGQDKVHADYLLARKAPLHMFAKWYFYHWLNTAVRAMREARAYCEPIPMIPKMPVAA